MKKLKVISLNFRLVNEFEEQLERLINQGWSIVAANRTRFFLFALLQKDTEDD